MVDALATSTDNTFDAAAAATTLDQSKRLCRRRSLGSVFVGLKVGLSSLNSPNPRIVEATGPKLNFIIFSCLLEGVITATTMARPIERVTVSDHPL